MKVAVVDIAAAIVALLASSSPGLLVSASLVPLSRRSFRTRSSLTSTTTRLFGLVEDARDLLRDGRQVLREWLPVPTTTNPQLQLVSIKPDVEGIGNALESTDTVDVLPVRNALGRVKFTAFEPKRAKTAASDGAGVGLVFYPGALVRAECYAPLCRALAERGYMVALLNPPLLLSLVDVDLANDALAYFGDRVAYWTAAGHSMGGVVAAAYANQHVQETAFEDKLVGVILLASYPSILPGLIAEGDLSDDDYIAASIYGSLDGLTTKLFIKASKSFLPDKTDYICIEGGNHSQFYYGTELQPGDNPPTISRDEQQRLICLAMEKVLIKTGKGKPAAESKQLS